MLLIFSESAAASWAQINQSLIKTVKTFVQVSNTQGKQHPWNTALKWINGSCSTADGHQVIINSDTFHRNGSLKYISWSHFFLVTLWTVFCWCLLACLALWHWKINPYFLDQVWHFYEAAVVLPPNDSVLSSVLHTRVNPGRAHHFSRFIYVVSAASSILCWLVNLKVTLWEDKARSSQTAAAAQRRNRKK